MTDSNNSETQLKDEFAQVEADETPFSAKDYCIEDWLALAVFTSLAFTLFAQFFSRYALGSSLGWTEEVARYLLICVAFLGGAMGMRKQTHISVTLFVRLLPPPIAQYLQRTVDILSLVFLICLLWFGIQITPRIHLYEMASLPLPLTVLYTVVLGGIVMMIFRGMKGLFYRGTQG